MGTSRRTDRSVRPFRLGALVVALALALTAAACGGDDGDDEASTDAGADSASSDAGAGGEPGEAGEGDEPADAFPVTIEHKWGETTIEAAPERVVTVGLTDQDAVMALGVAPVGVTEWFGDHPHAAFPWAVDALGDAEPEVVGTADAINFEQIAGVRPDLILAVYGGLTEDDYATLSQIAPTVAQPGEYNDFGVPWQEQTITIGRALGREGEAESLVADVEGRIAAAREEHPEFEGATGLVATPYQGTIWVYSPEDPRGRFLEALGFQDVPEISDLVTDGFGAELSMEQVDMLDVDTIVWIIDDPEANMAELHDVELYGRLPVVEEGREVPVVNLSDLGSATSFQTVLSIPSLVDGLVPMLASAIDGDPATEVEQPAG